MKRELLIAVLLLGCDEHLRGDKEDPVVAECERLGAEFDAAVKACVDCDADERDSEAAQ